MGGLIFSLNSRSKDITAIIFIVQHKWIRFITVGSGPTAKSVYLLLACVNKGKEVSKILPHTSVRFEHGSSGACFYSFACFIALSLESQSSAGESTTTPHRANYAGQAHNSMCSCVLR